MGRGSPRLRSRASALNSLRVRRPLAATVLTLVLATACGRPATEQDCDEIVSRIAELELREGSPGDPGDVKKQVEETRAAFHEQSKRECVGKRITAEALTCVRNATTAAEIVKECLN